jgi:sugar-phosphatase
MIAPRMPDAALFDMDGTLVDTEPLMGEALARVCAGSGLELGAGVLDDTIGQAWQNVHRQLAIHERLAWDLDEFLRRVHGEADDLIADGYPVRVLTGAVDLVVRLHRSGVPLGLVTGSIRREAAATLDRLGITECFSVTVTAEDYPVGKPDPSCYLLAARQVGADPAASVAFEDSTHGVAAARAAGLRVVATTEANRPAGAPGYQDLAAADVIVATLADVTDDLLQRLTAGISGRSER